MKFAGLDLDRPFIMGIVNATPDSFSDGGDAFSYSDAVERGLNLMEAGADIIDVGGESTRPGAQAVDIEDEIERTVPVVRKLTDAGAIVSIDTRHASVMEAAVDAGAAVINDVAALSEPGAMEMAAELGVDVVLMHMQGEPGTMQQNPTYEDAPGEVLAFLKARVQACLAAGIEADRITLDPGIGFGKTVEHNLEILNRLDLYKGLGHPLLIGASRKAFIGKIAGEPEPKKRMPGSVAVALWAVAHGANIVRVHDVEETKQALDVWQAMATGRA